MLVERVVHAESRLRGWTQCRWGKLRSHWGEVASGGGQFGDKVDRQVLLTPGHFSLAQLRAAEVEIKDLQSEFQLEKIDYLATIRRQERDSMLFQQLLEQVQPLIRRDCNYSNLEKIRRESSWDEDNGFWKIPEPIILKTSLPVGQVLSCPAPPPPCPFDSWPPCRVTKPGLGGRQVCVYVCVGR